MNLPDWRRYDYNFDPDDNTGPAWILHFVGKHQRVLDLGCGSGIISRYLSERNGCQVTGIEIDPVQASLAETFCQRVLVADLEQVDLTTLLDGERFKVIVAADILEHLRNPWSCLQSLHHILEPDGYLVACLPHAAHNGLLAHLLRGNFQYRNSGLLDYSHLRFFTRTSIKAMLEECGYLISEWESYTVPAENTEFAADWEVLTDTQRELFLGRHEGEIYQYVIKASVDPNWKVEVDTPSTMAIAESDEANEVEAYRMAFLQAHSLLTEREQQLTEYQQAFATARQLLQKRDAELAAVRQQLIRRPAMMAIHLLRRLLRR